MEEVNKQGHFRKSLEEIQALLNKGALSIEALFSTLGLYGHSLLLIFLCLPYLQPFPLPGLSTPLGFINILVAWQLFRGQPPWIPQKFKKLEISSVAGNKMLEIAHGLHGFLQKLLKERWSWFIFSPTARLINFCIVLISSLLLMLPLPIPLSNTIPAVPILLMAFGLLEEDGLAVLLSWILSLSGLGLFYSLGGWIIHFVSGQIAFVLQWLQSLVL